MKNLGEAGANIDKTTLFFVALPVQFKLA